MVTVNISTKTRLASLHPLRHFYALSLPWAALLLVFGGVFVDRSRRSKATLVAASVTFGLCLSLVACGGGTGGNGTTPPPPPQGTPAGSYSVTVTATSGRLTHHTSVSLAVQ